VLTVTLPTARIIELFGPEPAGVRVALWNQLDDDLPVGVDPVDVDIVLAADMPTVEPFQRIASAAVNVRLLQLATAGYEHVNGLFRQGVTIANGRGVHSDETAELAVSLALANLRGIDIFARRMPVAYWPEGITKRPTMTDRKALVVGAGSIASQIVGRLRGLKADVTVVARTSRESEIGHVHGIDELPDLLPQAECLFLSIPLTEATEHLIGARELSLLPHGALVVNVARGRVVDTEALTAEVEKGRLRASLDVTDPEPLPESHPLWRLPGVLISPHCGGDTPLSDVRLAELMRRQVAAFQQGGALENVVLGPREIGAVTAVVGS
jgi:phosphoglycerate dehydrogenase-like enzyme